MNPVDHEAARRHIEILTGSADTPVTLVGIVTGEDRPPARRGTISNLAPWIDQQQKRGASVYVTVNETATHKRAAPDITMVRAIWVDDDVPGPVRTEWPVPPTLTIETSPGKFHYYWKTRTAPGSEFKGVMECMVTHHGNDNGAKDIARVLRLAGTFNLKNPAAPYQARIVFEGDPSGYSWGDILAAFPPIYGADGQADGVKLDVDDAINTLLTGGKGMHPALIKMAARYVAKGLEKPEIEELLRALILSGGGAHRVDRLEQIPAAVASAIAKYAPEFGDIDLGDDPDPVDLFGSYSEPMEFVPGDYPHVIARLATDIALRMGCDPKIPAWSAIVVCAALLPDDVRLCPKAHDYTWSESARLWVAHVGPPSSKKSPPMAAVLAAVNDVQKRAYATYRDHVDAWEVRAADAKREKLPEPKKPTLARIIVGDATTEALTSVCRDNSEGVLVVHDELTGFFGAMDAYRQNGATKDRSLWLQTYNGGQFVVDRAGKGPTFIANLSACMLGGIQPDPMRKIAGKLDDDGLLQRFIVLMVGTASDGVDRAPDANVLTTWQNLVQELADLRGPTLGEWPALFKLAPDAQTVVDNARAKITAMARSPGVDTRLASALAKGEGQLVRLVLTFHAIEDRSSENLFFDGTSPSELISVSTAQRAVRLYFNLVVPSMHQFYGDLIGVSPTHEHARWVAGYILASGANSITAHAIGRAYRALRGDNVRQDILRCMEVLEHASWVAPLPRPGRDPKAWRVNAMVHTKFAERATRERTRRERERAEISRQIREASTANA